MSKKLLVYFGLFVILVIGTWLRFSGILSNSFAFTYDVGRDMLAIKSIVVDHKFTLIGQTTGVEGIFYGPWWYLILSIPFYLFSGNPQGVAFFMGFIGVATIFLGFIVGKKIGGDSLGIFFSAFIGISPPMVASSSQIWNPNLIPFLCVLVLSMLYMLVSHSKHNIYKIGYLFLLGIFLGLIVDMEIVFGVLFFLSVCSALVFVIRKRSTLTEITVLILGILLIFSPRIIFDIRHNFLMIRKASGFLNNDFLSSESVPILSVFLNRLEVLFNLWKDTLAGQNNIVGFILIIFVLLSLLKFYKRTDHAQKQFIKITFIVFGFFLVGLTLFGQSIWPHYLVGLPIFYIFILALAVNSISTDSKKRWIVIFLSFVLFWINLNPVKVLDNIAKPVWEGNAAVYRNQIAVVEYVYRDAKGQHFKYIAYTPAVHDYSYRYLFFWYGTKMYGYAPSDKNPQLFYVILEPDHDLPFRLKDWLKLREGDGIVQKEEVVKGGIVVQTRLRKK